MFRRFAARFVVGTSVLLLAMAGGSSAWAQYGDHYGHGHGGSGYYGMATMPRQMAVPFAPTDPRLNSSSQMLPRRPQIPAYPYPTLAPNTKPFSDYRPAPSIDWRKYQSRRR